jgi:hypothetical protein
MTLPTAIMFLTAGVAAAQGLRGPAPVGCFADEEGRLRPLRGLAGNFVVGEPTAEGVEMAACTETTTVFRTAEALVIRRDGEEETQALRDAVFGLTQDGGVVTWAGAAPGSGEVLALASPAPGRAVAVVRRDARLLLVRFPLDTGVTGSEQELNGVDAPVLLLPDARLVRVMDGKLTIRDLSGGETARELPGPVAALEFISRDWIRIRLADGGGSLLLRPGSDDEPLYRMPEVGR